MKIKLDDNEMAAILVDWAKRKYKTHNVSPTFGISFDDKNTLKSLYIELEVTLSDDQISDTPVSEMTTEAIKRIKELHDAGTRSISHDAEPDFSPQFEERAGRNTLPI